MAIVARGTIETTIRHLGVDIEEALTLSEHTEL